MIHVLILACYAVVALRDGAPPGAVPLATLSAPWAVALSLAPQAAIAALLWRRLASLGRRLDETGAPRHLERAHGALARSRWLATLWHGVSVFAFGWLDVVRTGLGDTVGADELLAMAPPLVVFAAGWWAFFPIERRLLDATMLRSLDEGAPVEPPPTRAQFVADRVRHSVLVILLPVAALVVWSEGLDRALAALDPEGARFGEWSVGGLHLLGMLLVLGAMPAVLTRVWRTVPLGPGLLRDRLEELCRLSRVRVRRILVWRTRHTMVNGALLGFAPPLRYILLTDALLDRLPLRQVEAVMAHEIAHARRRHLPWLLLTILVAVVGSWAVASLTLRSAWPAGPGPWALGGAALACAVAGTLAFGHVSRLFERQADAYAAQSLSGLHAGAPRGAGPEITAEAVGAMAGALAAVASLNRIDPGRFTFRHGSIRARVQRLERLVGLPARRVPVDRAVRSVKLVTLGAFVGLALLLAIRPGLLL